MTSPGHEIPSHRACAHCRSQKVRCIASDNDPDTCQRCQRSGRPCVFTPLQKRKQRKRTDTRVAELEREMRAMRSALKQKEEATRSFSPPSQEVQRGRPQGLWFKDMQPDAPRLGHAANWVQNGDDEGQVEAFDDRAVAQSNERGVPSLWPLKFPNWPQQHDVKDVVDKGVLSMETARQLFETYRTALFPHYPMVVIPPSATADDMRHSKPVLFLAIIAAAAGKEHSELSGALDKEVLQAYATRSLVQSEKSLELVQALLISAVWYHPPTKFGQLKYYEYIHMAATMAMDIGIGSRPTVHKSRYQQHDSRRPPSIHPAEDMKNPDLSMTPRSREASPDTGGIESRRTFLACYAICASVSLSLRRPNMLRVSSYIRDCVDFLERSPHAIATDRMVVAWVRLIMIADEISMSFSYDDPGGCASITELRTQLMLKDFSNRLSTWFASVPEVDMGTGSLAMMYYTIRLYLNEIALHIDHSPEDFRAPYQMGAIHPFPDTDQIPTQILAESIAECINCAHSLIGTFISMAPDSLRALPVFSYVRVSFAAFVLAKLCLSASHSNSRIGKVVDRSSLKAENYMDRAILHVRAIVGNKKCRVPAIFLALLFKLRQWCLNPETIEQPEVDTPDNDQGVRAIDGPRIIEQPSSNESSPQHVPGGLFADAMSDAGTSQLNPGHTPESQSDQSERQLAASGNLMPEYTTSNPRTTNPAYRMPNQYTAPSNEPMEIDPNTFSYLGDMNAFAAGGLTGLDDWGMMPDMSQMDFMDFQAPQNTFNDGAQGV